MIYVTGSMVIVKGSLLGPLTSTGMVDGIMNIPLYNMANSFISDLITLTYVIRFIVYLLRCVVVGVF